MVGEWYLIPFFNQTYPIRSVVLNTYLICQKGDILCKQRFGEFKNIFEFSTYPKWFYFVTRYDIFSFTIKLNKQYRIIRREYINC